MTGSRLLSLLTVPLLAPLVGVPLPSCTYDAGSSNEQADAFRATSVLLAKPHPFAREGADAIVMMNAMINENIAQDMSDPEDGLLNLNLALIFGPLDAMDQELPFTLSFPDCSAPLATTGCVESAATETVTVAAVHRSSCPENTLAKTCFTSAPFHIDLPLGWGTLPLQDARFSAQNTSPDAIHLQAGRLSGFVDKSDADRLRISDAAPQHAGRSLSSLLSDPALTYGPSGAPGWWFHFEIEATAVSYTID